MSVAALNDWPWLHWRQRCPGAIAIDCGPAHASLRWHQLADAVAAQASGFSQQGVEPGMTVALRGHNSLQLVLAWMGLLASGAKVLVLNPHFPDALLTQLLPDTGASYALSFDAPPCPGVAQLSPAVKGDKTCSLPPWQPMALATLTFTSGSTGLPKAAVHSFEAHLRSAESVTGTMGFTSRDSWLLSLPMCHVSGLGIIWRWLFTGATLVIDASKDSAAGLARSNFASLVPTQLWRLLEQSQLPAGLKTVLLGGAAIPDELVRRAEAAGIRCWCGYGLTEAASTVCVRRASIGQGVGAPLAGQEVKLVDNEVWIRSPTLARGYWSGQALRSITDAGGWLHTGDVAQWAGSDLLITGRRDNLFFSGGEAVQPEAIERVLMGHPDIAQAIVLPQSDREFGQRPVALVTTTTAFADLAQWAAPQLAGWQRPVAWYPLPTLAGEGIKPSRQRLKAWLDTQV